jgi:AraC family transcriptional regulator, regulatory protein of adaptative response / methylated-DNA-[protein]-cysteine methyltransferase
MVVANSQMNKWWNAVLARDVKLDGKIYYGVKSTGIFCRPSCPSRRPNRENVEFFASTTDAKQGGYRACKRCSPEETLNPKAAFIGQIVEYIDMHSDEMLTLKSLSERFGMSPFHLQRTFKAVVGVTPKRYLEACRLDQLKRQLQSGQQVSAAVYEAGFGSSSRLYEKSNSGLGMTPATYGRKGQGAKIIFGTFKSSLGIVLIAATNRGVCFLQFGDSEHSLINLLNAEFEKASLERDEPIVQPWFDALQHYLNGKCDQLELPLEVHGTAFQFSVWQHLRSLPVGQTASYGAVANALGDPNAARAVARACASNRIAIAIPCHRVIRENGDLGGYRWGIEKKRTLLDRERQNKLRH